MAKYRVHYGNGQVSETFASLNEASLHIIEAVERNEPYTALYRIQWQDPLTGDWFTARTGARWSHEA